MPKPQSLEESEVSAEPCGVCIFVRGATRGRQRICRWCEGDPVVVLTPGQVKAQAARSSTKKTTPSAAARRVVHRGFLIQQAQQAKNEPTKL